MSDAMRLPRATAQLKLFPLVVCCFIGGGLAALIYEIVWFQLLQFVIGSTAASLAVLLGTFMGGMCFGSLALPRLVPPSFNPLPLYAVMEVGIGLMGIAVLYLLPPAADLYASFGAHGFASILFRAVLCAAFLLIPTALMGATLPCIARWVEGAPQGPSRLGILYTGNLAGAVFGCLVAGFYLLRLYDMATATFVAAAVNACCAALAIAIALLTPPRAPPAPAAADQEPPAASATAVYVTIALSGSTALGAQVLWTRLLSLLLGASVYTFSIVLAVFLIGLGLGSSAGSLLARNSAKSALALLGWCQILLVAAIAWAAFNMDAWLIYWPVDPRLSISPWVTFQLDLTRCLWAVLPAACLWGASFPLALAAAAPRQRDAGRTVAAVYAANTIGAIIGAVGVSIVVIPAIGTLWTHRILIAAAAFSAVPILLARLSTRKSVGARLVPTAAAASGIIALALGAGALAYAVPGVPGELYAFGRSIMNPDFPTRVIYVGEGVNSSIAVSKNNEGFHFFHVSGKIEASSNPVDMRLQRMLAHLPALFDKEPRSALIVGFGAGVTAGTFVTYPEIERIVICEIEPLIPQKVSGFFGDANNHVIADPRVEIVYDDARSFIRTTEEKFDIITSDPIHPWVKGAASLYTRQYFEEAKRHLKPGGVVTQWVPLYESTVDVVKSELATFFAVFPDGIAWINDQDGAGDVVLFGQADPGPLNVDAAEQRFNANPRVAASLHEIDFDSVIDLLASYAGRGPDLQAWLQDAAINTDADLRLQYLAGLALNVDDQDQIYQQLMAARRFPSDLFTASAETAARLYMRPVATRRWQRQP